MIIEYELAVLVQPILSWPLLFTESSNQILLHG